MADVDVSEIEDVVVSEMASLDVVGLLLCFWGDVARRALTLSGGFLPDSKLLRFRLSVHLANCALYCSTLNNVHCTAQH